MGSQPMLCTRYHPEQLFRIGITLELCLTLTLAHPQYGIIAIGIYCLVYSLLPHKRQGMNNGKKLTDIVRSVHRAIVEYLLSGGKIDASILHRPGITAASGIHGPCVGAHI